MGTLINPQNLPSPALDYNAFCQCGSQNSGNFYDFIPQPHNRLMVSMGDCPSVSEGQSITTPCLQFLIRGLAESSRENVTALARELNGILYSLGPSDLCIPWFYASIDAVRHELQYVNAGHESPFLVRRRGVVHRLERTGAALGFSAHSTHGRNTIEVEPGDLLVMFSEGVAETLADGRLLDIVLEHNAAGTAELTQLVFQEVERSTDRTWPAEDRTFAAARLVDSRREPLPRADASEELLVCAA